MSILDSKWSWCFPIDETLALSRKGSTSRREFSIFNNYFKTDMFLFLGQKVDFTEFLSKNPKVVSRLTWKILSCMQQNFEIFTLWCWEVVELSRNFRVNKTKISLFLSPNEAQIKISSNQNYLIDCVRFWVSSAFFKIMSFQF